MVCELQEFVKRAIAPYKYPLAIEFVSILPRTETGKRAVPAPPAGRSEKRRHLSMSAFHATRIVRFAHCDPAGIIFYPRYFDLIHEVKEDWFRDALDWSFAKSIVAMKKGFPIVRLASEFHAPSRLGEELGIVLSVPRLGRSSIAIDYE